MENRALWRTLRALSHPATLGAVIVLLLNDHLLRIAWPSWWTGKLGDFSWLVFFPFILAAPLALVVPARVRRQPEIVAGLAFGLTGLMFASMKTIPAAMSAGLWVLRHITGGPFILRVDPTDLLALPGLLIGWWVWRQAARPASASRGWAVLALGALATIANTRALPQGMDLLSQSHEGEIVGTHRSGGFQFASADGGLSWREIGRYEPEQETRSRNLEEFHEGPWQLADPENPLVQYRFTPDTSIERSDDGGSTWRVEIDLRITQAQAVFYHQLRYAGERGPLDAVIDQRHRTIIVAMGEEGVLTRTVDGKWRWVSVGDPDGAFFTRHSDVRTLGEIIALLTIQLFLAAGLIFLIPGTLALSSGPGFPSIWRMLNGVLAWGLWVLVFFYSPVGFDSIMRLGFYIYILPFYSVGGLIFGVIGLYILSGRSSGIPWEVWLCVVLAPVIFLLPYILWSQGIITELMAAMVASVALAVAAIGWAGYRIVKRSLAAAASQGKESQP